MSTIDYGKILSEALDDTDGNGYRAEAAARAFLAALFAEAANACGQARRAGFPLVISALGEPFGLNTGPFTAWVTFSREHDRVILQTKDIAAAALGGRPDREEIRAAAIDASQLLVEVRARIAFAIEALARQQALKR
jgi:hypothetical protein